MVRSFTRRVRVALTLGVCGAMTASLVSCGEDRPTTQSTATGTPITIGVVATMSNNPGLAHGASAEGLKAWAATTNGRGGLDNHPIEIVVKDDGNDPAKSLTAVKDLVENEKVDAIAAWSTQSAAWSDYAAQTNIPFIGGQASGPMWQEGGNLFPVQTTVYGTSYAQGMVAQSAGAQRMGIFYTSALSVAVEAARQKKPIFADLGLESVYEAAIDPNQSDYTAPCLAAKDADAEAVVLSGVPAERVTPSCKQQGYEPIWVYPVEVISETVLETPALSNALVPQASFPYFLDVPETQDYRASMDTDYRGPEDEKFGPHTATSWMVGLVLREAMKNVGSKDVVAAGDLMAALTEIDNYTADGLLPGLTYTDPTARINRCFWEYKIADGGLVAPNGLNTTCAPEPKR